MSTQNQEPESDLDAATNDLVKKWQARCPHPPNFVAADMAAANAVWMHDHTDYQVRWCMRCGAIGPGSAVEFTSPSADIARWRK